MRKKILLVLLPLIVLGLIFGVFQTEQKQLKLSDFPEVFKKNTLIIVGDNASEIEMQAANDIAFYLEKETGNKPLVKKYSEVSNEDKRNYNLIVVGTLKSNPFLEEIYAMTNVTRVNESFPGEGKGILEILRNPWNKEKALLLVEGSDEWGVKAGNRVLLKDDLHDNKMIVKPSFSLSNLEKIKLSLIIEGWGDKLKVNGIINKTQTNNWILHANVEKYNFSKKYYSREISLNVSQEIIYDLINGIDSKTKEPEIKVTSFDYVETITLVLYFTEAEVVISNWHPTNPFDNPWLIQIKDMYGKKSYYSNSTVLRGAVEKIRNDIINEVE